MLRCARWHAVRSGPRAGARSGAQSNTESGAESGATLVELLVAIALIGTTMTAVTTFLVTTVGVTTQQGGKQAAIQVAQDATDLVRSMRGSTVIARRDQASSTTQWTSPVPGAAAWLATMTLAWDPAATFPSGTTAPLPTTPQPVLVDGVSYARNWYIGRCWQPGSGGVCGVVPVAGYVEFFQVVVAVTWPERHCPANACVQVTSTLVSANASDPVFAGGPLAPPVVTRPSTQIGELTVPVPTGFQFAATGGTDPVTWSCLGLPPGLLVNSSGLVTGTPTVAGSFAVTARAVDGTRLVGIAAFTWVVNPTPTLTNPGPQVSAGGSPVLFTPVVTGGTAPMTWSVAMPGPWGATGLPPGLAINPNTGAITGTPTRAGPALPVTITVTDVFARSAQQTFTWAVPQLQLATPPAQSDNQHGAIKPLTVVATGGIPGYTWSAAGLPPGLTINPNGVISGTPTQSGTYSVTVTVTDAAKTAVTCTAFVWTIR